MVRRLSLGGLGGACMVLEGLVDLHGHANLRVEPHAQVLVLALRATARIVVRGREPAQVLP